MYDTCEKTVACDQPPTGGASRGLGLAPAHISAHIYLTSA